MTQPKCYFLIGLPASGKSTYVKNVILKNYDNENQYHIASTDDIIEDIALNTKSNYNTVFKEVPFSIIQEIFDNKLKDAFSKNKDVIWDQTNLSKKSRKKKVSIIPEHYEKIAIVFDIDEEVRKERSIKRDIQEKKHIPNHIVENMKKTADYDVYRDETFHKVIIIEGNT